MVPELSPQLWGCLKLDIPALPLDLKEEDPGYVGEKESKEGNI